MKINMYSSVFGQILQIFSRAYFIRKWGKGAFIDGQQNDKRIKQGVRRF